VTHPGRIEEQLRERGVDEAALAAGRVFVDGKRVSAETEVALRQWVEVRPARSERESTAPGEDAPRVLFAERGLVVVSKPAGMVTEPDRRGSEDCLLAAVAEELGLRRAELHAANRLDLGVSGLVVLATSAAMRQALEAARKGRRWAKRYVAVAAPSAGAVTPVESGTWDAPVRAHRARQLEAAVTRFRLIALAALPTGAPARLLALEPVTGRTHQLRIHAANAGMPLYGDRAYGGPARVVAEDGRVAPVGRIALHAARIELTLTRGEMLRFDAAVPAALEALWSSLGGDPEAWNAAREAPLTP
jgi:23S rRNA-/tRNA-specific pseudouridylate synthase